MHTMQPYVMSLRCDCSISGFVRNEMVLVVVASWQISLLNDWLHTSLYFGFFSRCFIPTGLPFCCPKWSLPSCKGIVVGISVLTLVVRWVLLLFP
jgi:hypothetical protein